MLRQWNSATQTPSRLVGSLSLALLLLAMLVALGLRATPRSAAADRSLNHEPAAKTGIETINSTTALLQVSDEPTTSHVWSLVALLKSVPVIQPTLRRPEIANLPIIAAQNDPLQWVIDHLDVGPIADSNVVYVRMKDAGRDTEQLRTLVDAVVQKSLDASAAYDRKARAPERDALAKRLTKLSADIKSKFKARNALAEELGNLDGGRRDAELESLTRELAEVTKAKAALKGQLAELQANFMLLDQQFKDPRTMDAQIDEQLADDPNMNMINQELMGLQYQLNAQSGATNHRSKEADRLQQLIHAKQQQIAQHRAQWKLQLQPADGAILKPDLEKYPIPRMRDPYPQPSDPRPRAPHDDARQLQQRRKEFQIRAGLLQQQLQVLNKSIDNIHAKLSAWNRRSVELEVDAAELKQLQQIANELSLTLERMDVEAAAPPRVRVIQWAM